MLNIGVISYLVASFKDTVNTIGKTSEAVEYWKRQVTQLQYIGQIGQEEINVVNKVVGMENTNAVKWASAEKKLTEFINIMNDLWCIETSDKEAIKSVINYYTSHFKVSEDVVDAIREIYDIKDMGKKLDTANIRFGTYGGIPVKKQVKSENTGNHGNNALAIFMKKVAEFQNKNDLTYVFQIDDGIVTCGGNTGYISVKLDGSQFFNLEWMKGQTRLLEALKHDKCSWQIISIRHMRGDDEKELERLLKKVDLKNILKELRNLTLEQDLIE